MNHRISKEIVSVARRTGRGIAVELLDGIRDRVRLRRDQRPARRILESRKREVVQGEVRRDEQAALRRWMERIPGLTQEPELIGRHAVLSYVRTVPMASVPS